MFLTIFQDFTGGIIVFKYRKTNTGWWQKTNETNMYQMKAVLKHDYIF